MTKVISHTPIFLSFGIQKTQIFMICFLLFSLYPKEYKNHSSSCRTETVDIPRKIIYNNGKHYFILKYSPNLRIGDQMFTEIYLIKVSLCSQVIEVDRSWGTIFVGSLWARSTNSEMRKQRSNSAMISVATLRVRDNNRFLHYREAFFYGIGFLYISGYKNHFDI